MGWSLRGLMALLPLGIALGCSASDGGEADDGIAESDLTSTTCTVRGATACEGQRVKTCRASSGRLRWSTAVECPLDQGCRDNACREPTVAMRGQAANIATLVDTLSTQSAWHARVDANAVRTRESKSVLKGDGSDASFYGAAWRVMNAFPQGHQGMSSPSPEVCGSASLRYQNLTRFNVCGRQTPDGSLVVTAAARNNRLGLSAGDVVVQAGDDRGPAILDKAYMTPVCGGIYPTAAGRRDVGAASFFGVVPAGTKLVVRGVDGRTRDVVIPNVDDPPASCEDPFGRRRDVHAEASMRPDGVAVIRVPSWMPLDEPFPQTEEGVTALRARFEESIGRVFDTVKTARAIVWDVRGNGGGLTPVGLAIVGGFPSARATALSYCKTRIPGPTVSFDGERYAEYRVTPGGRFAFAGKVAVLTDGLNYSAADYFAFAAHRASNAIVVGGATAGAFGGGHGPIELPGPPALSANFDMTGCFDASNDAPLEGTSLPPTVPAGYLPADLAAGKDTVLERAAAELLSP